MPKSLAGARNRRGAGVGGAGTAPEKPKSQFYSRPDADGDVLDVPVDDISPNPFNDRGLGDLDALAESIAADGLLEDIAVVHRDVFAERWPDATAGLSTKYVLAFGERRWRATQKAGLSTIRAVLRNDVVDRVKRVLIVENFHRKNYTPMEEARNFHRLATEEGMSYRDIAKELKIGPTHVSRRLKLLKLPPAVQEVVDGGGLPTTHAMQLLDNLGTSELVVAAWDHMVDTGCNVQQAIEIVQGAGVPAGNTTSDDESDTGDTGRGDADGPAVPAGNSETTDSAEQHATNNDSSAGVPGGNSADGSQRQGGGHSGEVPASSVPSPRGQRTSSSSAAEKKAADTVSSAERNKAAADRDAACERLVGAGYEPAEEDFTTLYARTLLAPIQQQPARTKAHLWLRKTERDQIDVRDTDSYFQAILSSGQLDLLKRVTFATALAAGELRAKDGRRQWDRTDAQHVQFLISAAGYRPATQWEQKQLSKFGVDLTAETADQSTC